MDYTVSLVSGISAAVIHPGVQWEYVCESREPPAYSQSDNALLEFSLAERDADRTITARAQNIALEPHLLGNFAWAGTHVAHIIEKQETSGAHYFSVRVGVPNIGSLVPHSLWNDSVTTGGGQYAWALMRYTHTPEGGRWLFHEFERAPSKNGRLGAVREFWTSELTACRYPLWAIQQLRDEFLPRLEAWFTAQYARKAAGFQRPLSHWDFYQKGNPALHSENVFRPR